MNILTHSPFRTFWMGGYECADHLNAFGNRVDLLQETGHLLFLRNDYQSLKALRIETVREGIRWSVVEQQPYRYDWRAVDAVMDAAQETGIQVLWDICHFGFAADLTPLHPMFARRFAHLCRAFVQHYRSRIPDGTLIITPINEVSFLSWLGGDVRGTAPYTIGQGWDVKYHLMKAYIEGIEAMLAVDPGIRILTTEPLIHVLPGRTDDEEALLRATALNEDQFQVLEMLSGRICPELRGRPEYLDLLGLNYYYNNQWQMGEQREILPWHPRDSHPDHKGLHRLLEEVWHRYHRPMVLTETSHFLEDRPHWYEMIGNECRAALQKGLPLLGVCIYPVIDRPDWDHLHQWHRSGLWDIPDIHSLERVPHLPTLSALKQAQEAVAATAKTDIVLKTGAVSFSFG